MDEFFIVPLIIILVSIGITITVAIIIAVCVVRRRRRLNEVTNGLVAVTSQTINGLSAPRTVIVTQYPTQPYYPQNPQMYTTYPPTANQPEPPPEYAQNAYDEAGVSHDAKEKF